MILKQLLFGSLVFAGMCLTSCAGSDKEGASSDQADSLTTATAPSSPMTSGGDTSVIQMPTQAPAGPTAEGMNPAHGAPGHDCAIPVGAPLNSAKTAPGTTPQINTQQAPQVVPAPQSAAPAGGGSGKMNPAHGQPGHDCKVAVGAPLP